MFNDKYIIGAPQPIRAMIGQIIITKRLKESQENYHKLGGMSPIVGHTKRLVRRLNKELDADVFYEMRYTPPFCKWCYAKTCKLWWNICNSYVSHIIQVQQQNHQLKIL